MFREKDFLISKGVRVETRADVFYLLGYFYDDAIEHGVIDIDQFQERQGFLDNHREELLEGKDYSIAQYDTIRARFKEIGIQTLTQKQILKLKEQQTDDINDQHGIYGIYIDDELVYIGETEKSFHQRFLQHKAGIKNSDEYKYRILRAAKEKGHKVYLDVLIAIEELQVDKKITSNDIKSMELALITMYKPKLNIEGVTKPYLYSKSSYKKN